MPSGDSASACPANCLGVNVIGLDSAECFSLLAEYIRVNPSVRQEDIGQE